MADIQAMSIHPPRDNPLAAQAPSQERGVIDIDIEINRENCQKARELFKDYIVEDFRRYSDGEFDLWMMTLDIDGIPVDINQVEESYIFKGTAI